MKSDIEQRVSEVIDGVRPYIQQDGGDVELVGIEDNVVLVRLSGACVGCAMAHQTLKVGIEQKVVEAVPEIVRVDALFY
jgi:Fe-S cluster biogenesis protein NfuA